MRPDLSLIKRLSSAEKKVLNKKIRMYRHTKIMWVYFLFNKNKLVYIGVSDRPRKRLYHHRCNIVPSTLMTIDIKGPFDRKIAFQKEKYYIETYGKTSNLKNINSNGKRKKNRPQAKKSL